eukprot:COSAG06_NODE_15410_length_1072_cov_3.034943_1_plen_27_part_10
MLGVVVCDLLVCVSSLQDNVILPLPPC